MPRFLQHDYHRGGYFQDNADKDPDLRDHDFSQPTGDDRGVDRTLLPEVMQVKKFGFKGRTKWTHLTDQDTSGYKYTKPGKREERPHSSKRSSSSSAPPIDNPWLAAAKDPKFAPIVAKHKMGGVGGGFSRPSKRPKKAPEKTE